MSFAGSEVKKSSAGPTARTGGHADVFAGDLDRERFGAEARAVAGLARHRGLVLRQFLAHPRAFGGEHAAIEVADDALKRLLDLIALAAVDELQDDGLAARAEQDRGDDMFGQLVPGCVEAEAEMRGQTPQDLHVNRGWAGSTWPRARPRPS